MSDAPTLSYSAPNYEPPGLPMTGILQVQGLTKTFRMGDSGFDVLHELNFDLQEGEFVAIEGRSGSGKSTLLHVLAALDSVDSGTVNFKGADYTRRTRENMPAWLRTLTLRFKTPAPNASIRIALPTMFGLGLLGLLLSQGFVPERAQHPLLISSTAVAGLVLAVWILRLLAYLYRIIAMLNTESPTSRLRNLQFGFIFQFYHLLPELNVVENTMLAPSIEHSWLGFRRRKQELQSRAISLLEQLGMGHRLWHRPAQLSGGERQRVAIARALMNSPKVLFADEPTGNLDDETGRQIMDVLEQLHREHGQTIVMVTHDRSLAREADRVLVLKGGKLEQVE